MKCCFESFKLLQHFKMCFFSIAGLVWPFGRLNEIGGFKNTCSGTV